LGKVIRRIMVAKGIEDIFVGKAISASSKFGL